MTVSHYSRDLLRLHKFFLYFLLTTVKRSLILAYVRGWLPLAAVAWCFRRLPMRGA